MKLRVKGNSIRLRLTQTDVAQFAREARVAEALHFPDGRHLTYALVATASADVLGARFTNDEVTVMMPRTLAAEWYESDRVGFDGTLDLPNGRQLALLIEKDFKCLHRRAEDEHAYPHPLAGEQS